MERISLVLHGFSCGEPAMSRMSRILNFFSEALKSYSKQQIFSSKKIDYLIVINRTESMKASIAKNAF